MAAATARGTSDACIFPYPRRFAPEDRESVQPAHDTDGSPTLNPKGLLAQFEMLAPPVGFEPATIG